MSWDFWCSFFHDSNPFAEVFRGYFLTVRAQITVVSLCQGLCAKNISNIYHFFYKYRRGGCLLSFFLPCFFIIKINFVSIFMKRLKVLKIFHVIFAIFKKRYWLRCVIDTAESEQFLSWPLVAFKGTIRKKGFGDKLLYYF